MENDYNWDEIYYKFWSVREKYNNNFLDFLKEFYITPTKKT